jgi:MFS family permease
MELDLSALASIQAGLGAGQSAVQLTLSAVALGLAVGQLIAGPLSDRFGRRRPLLVGIGTWSLASLLCAPTPTAWVLIATRLVQGIGGSPTARVIVLRDIGRHRFDRCPICLTPEPKVSAGPLTTSSRSPLPPYTVSRRAGMRPLPNEPASLSPMAPDHTVAVCQARHTVQAGHAVAALLYRLL